ncbi:redox-regulated ATPase YchF [Candidatus Aerophobetes bacterium]|nr:redox-regulated ATPase YchF [Candidatus Aerophobetes bacterium]
MQVGIIGLPNAGKSTLFNALTKGGARVANFPFCTISPNVGMTSVPDPRLEKLGKLINPQRVTPAEIEFVDVAGLVKGAHQGEGLGNEFLSKIRGVDVLVEVARCFEEGISHPEGTVNPVRDIQIIELELFLSDLEIVQRRLTKLNKLVKSGVKEAKEKLIIMEKLKDALEKGESPKMICSKEEQKLIKEEGLLSLKPIIYVANIGEEDLNFPSSSLVNLRKYILEKKERMIEVCAQLEMELREFPLEEQREFVESMGIKIKGTDQLVEEAYHLLNLITFFTVTGGEEVKAWPVRKGTSALQAAGKVHSDMQKGFIRAEIITVSELLRFKSLKKAREEGKLTVEGKDYLVKDGDIIHFRFN